MKSTFLHSKVKRQMPAFVYFLFFKLFCFMILYTPFVFSAEVSCMCFLAPETSFQSLPSKNQINVIPIADEDLSQLTVEELSSSRIQSASNDVTDAKLIASTFFRLLSKNHNSEFGEILFIGSSSQEIIQFLQYLKEKSMRIPDTLHIFNPNPFDMNIILLELTAYLSESNTKAPVINLYKTGAQNILKYLIRTHDASLPLSLVYAINVLVPEVLPESVIEEISTTAWGLLHENGVFFVTGGLVYENFKLSGPKGIDNFQPLYYLTSKAA